MTLAPQVTLPRPAALQIILRNGNRFVLHAMKAAAVHSFLQSFLHEFKRVSIADQLFIRFVYSNILMLSNASVCKNPKNVLCSEYPTQHFSPLCKLQVFKRLLEHVLNHLLRFSYAHSFRCFSSFSARDL